ncbi:MAG: ABC transporter ATP-binding protein [Angelakisella sp.]
MPEIILKNINKRFGKFVAVENLDLVIADRDFVTLLGPSGCGKTTTLRMIAGLETPTSGEIYIDGRLVFSSEKGIDISPDKRDVGFLFQNYALWPHMTVYKNISFGLENMKWDKQRIDTRVKELLVMLRIEEFVDRYPSELSGGQQQRVAIARTLATGAKVLFMDEPLSNLDAKLRMEMRTELKRLHLETDSTFVYVTHDQLEAMTLSSKICLLKEGVLQQYQPPLEVYHNPANTFVADFVGSPNINFMEAVGRNVNLDEIVLEMGGVNLVFTPVSSGITVSSGQKLILGLRPEHIGIAEDGPIRGKIYSTLPSGMETIVKVEVGGHILTSVVFGGVDFKVDEEVGIRFDSAQYILFDKENGQNLALGKLSVV